MNPSYLTAIILRPRTTCLQLIQIRLRVAAQPASFRRQYWRLGSTGVEVGEFGAAVVVD